MATYKKDGENVLVETKEESVKYNITDLKQQKAYLEEKIAEIDLKISEADKLGIR